MVKQSHVATLPDLPTPTRQAVVASLLKTGLLIQVPVPPLDTQPESAGAQPGLTATDANLGGGEAAGSTTHVLNGLRAAAQGLLAAWEAQSTPKTLSATVEQLRTALARRATRPSINGPRAPRTDTKQANVLAMLCRPEGATVAQVIEATGWAPHTVRGFLAGLKRRGTPIEVLERVRQVGPGRAGAKGSYTVYRVAEAG